MAVKTVDNAITAMVKLRILRREGRCEYELNPAYFARGEWAHIRERREAFNLNISYTKGGRRIVGVEKIEAGEPQQIDRDPNTGDMFGG